MYKIDEHTGKINQTVQDKINAAYAFGGRSCSCRYTPWLASGRFSNEKTSSSNHSGLHWISPFTCTPALIWAAFPHLQMLSAVWKSLRCHHPAFRSPPRRSAERARRSLISGDKAYNYLRNRNVASGDFAGCAAANLHACIGKKIKSMGAVDIIVSLYTDLQRYAKTNLSTGSNGIVFAKLLKQVDIDNIQKLSVTGSTKQWAAHL